MSPKGFPWLLPEPGFPWIQQDGLKTPGKVCSHWKSVLIHERFGIR